MKGDEFRDRHRDRGKDMVLHLARWVCGMGLTALAQAVGLLNYAVAMTSAKRYEQGLQGDRAEQSRMKALCQLLNCKM